ncbi:hypothetical protein [Wenzhouxiangella limi]|uniref:Uncharacterized protein n=1 Tax=Wenzhouxiangella limi TaxID=2707351 RepID=A0A845V234_9GAMM|nr:hypothetical protein [Wenzhouxiangella limi]NDY96320.1 hypothetical protein [Wenzhouxiangella limi]
MNRLARYPLLLSITAALLIGLATGLITAPKQQYRADLNEPLEWALPELSEAADAEVIAAAVAERLGWISEQVVDEPEEAAAQAAAEAAAEAARLAEAERQRRRAHRWRFLGSTEQHGKLQSVFRAGDGRLRHVSQGEEIEHGARVIELHPGRVVVELPGQLQNPSQEPSGTVPHRLQLFRDTDLDLYLPDSAAADGRSN